MTKAQAIYNFWSGFGLTAYASSSVPDDVIFPYLTFENVIANAGDPAVSVTVNLWYHTDSEAVPNAKVEEIANAIGRGGIQIACDDGSIWIKRGAPWSTALSDESDPQIKRRMLNIEQNFM